MTWKCICGYRWKSNDVCSKCGDRDLDIPAFLVIPQAVRKASWRDYKPHPHHEQGSIERWRKYELQRRKEDETKTKARIEALRAAKGQEKFYD